MGKNMLNVAWLNGAVPTGKGGSSSGGGGVKWTGHVDAEGLRAIGWTDEDIAYYQADGVNWNEEDDQYHLVSDDNKALYGVLTADNIQDYKDRIVYLPKIDTSGKTSMNSIFKECYSLVAIPQLDTSSVTNMGSMFNYCYSLVVIPQMDTSNVTSMNSMFSSCYSLVSIPQLDTSNVTNMSYMFYECYSLVSIPQLDTSNVTSVGNMFGSCRSLKTIKLKGLRLTLDISKTSLLTKDSLLYIINNKSTTSAVTIKLSPYCYNKYSTDEDVADALSNHPNISLAQ